ncbi:MAG TPA: hypothetical protein VIK55_10150 [Paludibacter sp.]
MKNDKTNKVIISKKLLNFLIVCFWTNLLVLPSTIIFTFIFPTETFLFIKDLSFESNPFGVMLIFLMNIPLMSLFFYSFYFYFKYDKYSKSGIYLFIFSWIYAHIYFYNVIWKRKRELVNTFEHEQVLGNKIFIETEEEDEEDFDSKTEKL